MDHCQRLFSAIKQEAAAIAADKKMHIRDQQLQQLEAGYPELDDLMRLVRIKPPTTAEEELPSLLEQNPLMMQDMASSFGDSGGHQAQKKSKLKILRL